ncbi:hypothetical protein D3C71_256490 [compost metagenome]
MPSYLPVELEQFVDPASAYDSVRNLTQAAERGEISLSSVASFIRATERGDDIRFSRTRPIPLAMKEAIERRSDLLPRQVVYMGWKEGVWEWEDVEAWENNQSVLHDARTTPRKGVYLTRDRRRSPRKANLANMFVPKMNLEVLCRFGICDGAKACLGVLMALAGKRRSSTVVTYTKSIATSMGRTARSVRNYFIALEAAGLITRTAGRDPNTVRITISPECRPDPYQEPEDVKAYKLVARSSNPVLRMLAHSVAAAGMEAFPAEFRPDGRRKEISAFNLESNFFSRPTGDSSPQMAEKGDGRGPTTHSNLERPGFKPFFKCPYLGKGSAPERTWRMTPDTQAPFVSCEPSG